MKKRVGVLAVLIVFSMSLVSSMTINVSSPDEGHFYDSNLVNVNASCDEVVDWIVSLDGTLNLTSNNASNFISSLSLSENNHTLIISATNPTTNISNSSTISFYVDTLSPNITSQSPANGENVLRENVNFSVAYTEANLSYTKIYWKNSSSSYTEVNVSNCESGTSKSCSKIIDFSSYPYGETISYFFNLTDIFSRNTNSSVHTFRLICTPSWEYGGWDSCSGGTQTRTCTDTTGCKVNRDESRDCTDSETQTTTTTTNTNIQNINYFLSESQISNGSLRTLRLVGDKISFKIKNESHTLELRSISSDRVSIKISSAEQYADLTLNEMKKFDLTADGYYDVSVSLKKLNNSEAGILLNSTNEKVPAAVAATNPSDSVTASAEITGDALTETANETELAGGSITGGFLGALENMKEAPPYLLISFILIILGLLSITISKVIRKKKRRRKGYYK